MVRVLLDVYWQIFIGLAVEKEPILATEAVKVINDNVNENEVVEILGHPLKIQAEREFIIFLGFLSDFFCYVMMSLHLLSNGPFVE